MWYLSKIQAHQFMCTKLTLNLKLMCSTLNHLFGVVWPILPWSFSALSPSGYFFAP
jgi:hypothetical protein